MSTQINHYADRLVDAFLDEGPIQMSDRLFAAIVDDVYATRQRGLSAPWRYLSMNRPALAAAMIYVNQVGFVYAIDKTTASTVTLFLGTTPIFVGLVAGAIGLERPGGGFWLATALSFVGVGFVAAGSGVLSGRLAGDAIAVFTAATWGLYSIAIAPLKC